MWYRSAQLYDAYGKSLLEFGPLVGPPNTNGDTVGDVQSQLQPTLNRIQNQWSSVTWSPQYGLQFWTSNGKLVATQRPGVGVFETLRAFEPYRLKSDFTDKIVFDLYRRGKSIEQAVRQARIQNPAITPQQITQVVSQYMKEYYVTPKFDAQGNLQNLPEYYPQQSAQEDAVIRQNIEREYLTGQPNEQGFQFANSQSTETGQQYRARYSDAYAKAYASYEANGSKMPFAQWKKQFDEDFARGAYGTNIGLAQPARNQVRSQNQPEGTYRMIQDASGNVSILQNDNRAYSYIPASEVRYQLQYIQKMTGKLPSVVPGVPPASGIQKQ